MTIFQTPAFREVYAQIFGRGKQFFGVGDGQNHVWLQKRGAALPRLEFWGQGIADCGGALLQNPENAPKLWRQIERAAQSCAGAHLVEISAQSPLVELAKNAGWMVSSAEVCPTLELPATYDDYLKTLGKNKREQMRRFPRRLEKNFAVEYQIAQTEFQVREFLGEFFTLHGKRWRARGQTGVMVLPKRRRFQEEFCLRLLRENQLRLWRLRCDDKTVCVLINYFWGEKYWFFLGGFEPEMQKWSVGNVLFARIFQEAIGEGAREFDFLRGAEDYKYRFGAQDREFVNLKWFAPTPRGALLKRQIALEEEILRRVHEKFGAANADH